MSALGRIGVVLRALTAQGREASLSPDRTDAREFRWSWCAATVWSMNDLVSSISRLPAGVLPAGRVVCPEDGGSPVYWLSDEPAPSGAWSRFRAGNAEWHLWPLLLRGEDDRPEYPWQVGEVSPANMTPADQHDAAEQMQNRWRDYTEWHDTDDEFLSKAERTAITAPFGRDWPGLCPDITLQGPPDEVADGYAEFLHDDRTRLGLVAVERGSDSLWVTGWSGPLNYDNDSGVFAAIVRSWEDRFGARVVGLGPATLELSLAAPPLTRQQARHVAAEHFAFCPDSVWQGGYHNLEEYAASLIGQNCWSFWWD